MLIWRGWGIVSILIFGLVQVTFGEQLMDKAMGIPDGFAHYRDAHPMVHLLSGALAALACWFAGTWLEQRAFANGQQVIDKETGQEIRLVSRHDLFWIPVKWWSVVWLALGAVFAFH